jgi:hypothetical protein
MSKFKVDDLVKYNLLHYNVEIIAIIIEVNVVANAYNTKPIRYDLVRTKILMASDERYMYIGRNHILAPERLTLLESIEETK